MIGQRGMIMDSGSSFCFTDVGHQLFWTPHLKGFQTSESLVIASSCSLEGFRKRCSGKTSIFIVNDVAKLEQRQDSNVTGQLIHMLRTQIAPTIRG